MSERYTLKRLESHCPFQSDFCASNMAGFDLGYFGMFQPANQHLGISWNIIGMIEVQGTKKGPLGDAQRAQNVPFQLTRHDYLDQLGSKVGAFSQFSWGNRIS